MFSFFKYFTGKTHQPESRANKRLQDVKEGKRAWISLGKTQGYEIKIQRDRDD